MTHKPKTVILFLLALVLALVLAVTPIAWRASDLYWLKSSARNTFSTFSPEAMQILNTLPNQITLTDLNIEGASLDTFNIADHLVRVTRPLSHEVRDKWLILNYSQYQIIIRPDSSLSQSDAVARQLNFADTYAEYSASYHARPADVDAQPDVPSLRRLLILLSLKPNRIAYVEEFTRGDICGFISAPRERETFVTIFIPARQLGFGMSFVDQGKGVTLHDVHDFLEKLQFDPVMATTIRDTPDMPATQPDNLK